MLERYMELPVEGKYYLEYHLDPLTNLNLTIESCGILHAPPEDSRGPLIRSSISIYFILDGKGDLQIGNSSHSLEKGQGFFVPPNVSINYSANRQDPWSLSWIYFSGSDAEAILARANLSNDNVVFSYSDDDFLEKCVSQMLHINTISDGQQLRLLGILHVFLSELVKMNKVRLSNEKEDVKKGYTKEVVKYITNHYSKKISIEEMSQQIGLDRRYLGTIFKSYFKTSLKEFLTIFRVNKACDIMANSKLTLNNIASMVGYQDPLAFSKIFKKIKGVSPREYRKSLTTLEAEVLPGDWKSIDIGNNIILGSSSYNKGLYKIQGAGWDIWGDYDEFHFAYVELSGNCTITARVASISNTHSWCKAGIMVRETMEDSSKHAYVLMTPSAGISFQWRSTSSEFTECFNQRNLHVPEYLRLIRHRNSFSSFYSSNGVDWFQIGNTKRISMKSSIYVGLAVTSHIVGVLCTATFDNVDIEGNN